MLDKYPGVWYYNIRKRKEIKKEIKKMVTVKVFSKIGIIYYVEKSNIISAELFRLGHLLRGSGYQTEIV